MILSFSLSAKADIGAFVGGYLIGKSNKKERIVYKDKFSLSVEQIKSKLPNKYNIGYIKNKKITNEDQRKITFNNNYNIRSLKKRVDAFDKDDARAYREKIGVCAYCYYLKEPVMVMQAFWNWNCSCCLEEQPEWHNSGVPKACKKCSEKHNLCTVCCGDLDFKVKDKKIE